jgi:electron transfer flavoprotein beta subunit
MPSHIYVCVKHVPDSAATITVEGGNAINENVTFLMNPYDEHAITEAVRIRANRNDVEVIAVCLGKTAAQNTLRSAMAMGADRAILVDTERPLDSILTARGLAATIRSNGEPWLILTGKEAIDTEGMQTPFRLAANLRMPVATNVVGLTLCADEVQVECEHDPGMVNIIRMTTPCVLGAGKGLNTPIYPTFPDIVKSRRKPLTRLLLSELTIDSPSSAMVTEHLETATDHRNPERLEGSADEIASKIVDILKNEAKVF